MSESTLDIYDVCHNHPEAKRQLEVFIAEHNAVTNALKANREHHAKPCGESYDALMEALVKLWSANAATEKER